MNYWKVILATMVIFGAGVITGGLLNYVSRAHPENRHAQNSARNLEDLVTRPEILKSNFVQRLDGALHLSPEQRQQIEKIVAESQERNRNLWKIVAPQMHEVIQNTRQHIREVLNDDQKKEFEEFFHRPRKSPGANAPAAPAETSTNFPATNPPAAG